MSHFLASLRLRCPLAAVETPGVGHRVTGLLADLLTKAVARVTYVTLMRLYDAYAEDGIACPPA